MRVMIATPDLYCDRYPEYTVNRTGFGLMVYDILDSMSEYAETTVLSNKITPGHSECGIARHSYLDVLSGLRFQYLAEGIRDFLKYENSLRNRCKYLFYKLNKGYIEKAISEFKPDIVHIHSIAFSSIPYIEICEKMDIPFVTTLHGLVGISDSTLATPEDRALEKEFLKTLDEKNRFVTVVSSGIKRTILEHYSGDVEERVAVVCNGTRLPDVALDVCRDTENVLLRKELDSLQVHPRFIVVGNICERKNQKQVVEAAEILRSRANFIFSIMFCGRDTLDGRLQNMINERSLADIVKCAGVLDRTDLDAVYQWADFNIVASLDEGFGLSMVESMARGLPTVAFDDLDAVQDLYSPDSMYLVKERTADSLAAALLEAVNRRWDRDAIKLHAKQYSLEVMSERYLDEYAAVLDQYQRIKDGNSGQ